MGKLEIVGYEYSRLILGPEVFIMADAVELWRKKRMGVMNPKYQTFGEEFSFSASVFYETWLSTN